MGLANGYINPNCSKGGCCTVPLWRHPTLTLDKDTCDEARKALQQGFNEKEKKDGDLVSKEQTIVKCNGSVDLVLVGPVDSNRRHPTDKTVHPISIAAALGLLTK